MNKGEFKRINGELDIVEDYDAEDMCNCSDDDIIAHYGYEGLDILNNSLNKKTVRLKCNLKAKDSLQLLEKYDLVGVGTCIVPNFKSWTYKFRISSKDKFNNLEVVIPVEILGIAYDITYQTTKDIDDIQYLLCELTYLRDIYKNYVYPEFDGNTDNNVINSYKQYLKEMGCRYEVI